MGTEAGHRINYQDDNKRDDFYGKRRFSRMEGESRKGDVVGMLRKKLQTSERSWGKFAGISMSLEAN